MTEKIIMHENETVVLSKVASVELFDEHWVFDTPIGDHKMDDAHSEITFIGSNKGKRMSREIGEKVQAALKGENL